MSERKEFNALDYIHNYDYRKHNRGYNQDAGTDTEEREPMTRHEWNRYYNEMNGNRTKSYEDCSWAELGYCLLCDFIVNLI